VEKEDIDLVLRLTYDAGETVHNISQGKDRAMAKRFVQPDQVTSPRRHWTLVAVVHDEGEGKWAVAIGRWDGKHVLAMRWNGKEDNLIGNPQSRGLATWFVVPELFRRPILDRILSEWPEKKPLVDAFFAGQPATELSGPRVRRPR
jgi:hypothetical protein